MTRLLPLSALALLLAPLGAPRAQTVPVATGAELQAAVLAATPGTIIELTAPGPYETTADLANSVPITIRGAADVERPEIRPAAAGTGSVVRPGADLRLENLDLNAAGLVREAIRVESATAVDLRVLVDDCTVRGSSTGNDLIRIDLAAQAVRITNSLLREGGRRPVGVRPTAVLDTLHIARTTVWNTPDRLRIEAAPAVLEVDQSTFAGITGSSALDVQAPAPSVTITNSLFANNTGRAFNVAGGSVIAVSNTNAFPAATLQNEAAAAFAAGAGNFSEDPLFANLAAGNLAVSLDAVATWTGSSTGRLVGDPRYGLYAEDSGYVLEPGGAGLDVLLNQLTQAPSGFTVELIPAGVYPVAETIETQVVLTVATVSPARSGGDDDPRAIIRPVGTLGGPLFRPQTSFTLDFVRVEGIATVGAGAAAEVVRYDANQGGTLSILSSELVGSGVGDDLVRVEGIVDELLIDDTEIRGSGRRPVAVRPGTNLGVLSITNSTISDSAERIRIESAPDSTLLDRVTISGLRGTAPAFQVQAPVSNLTIRNSLISGNARAGVGVGGGSTLTIANTNIFETTPLAGDALAAFTAGPGNFSSTPNFRNAATGDFAIAVDSPSATGASDGTPVGDPRWGTYLPVAGESGADPLPFGVTLAGPNPARGQLALRVVLAEAAEARVAVFDALGRLVSETVAERSAGAHTVSFDTAQFAPGVYTVRLSAAGRTAAARVTVVR